MKGTLRKNNGITLIALVITIIVLLILAGVTLASLNGESSIFTRANEAAKATEFATVREELEVAYNSAYAENMAKVHVDREPTDLKTAISEAMNPILQKYAQENANKKAAIVVEPTSNLTFDASGKTTIKLTYKADGSHQTGIITVRKSSLESDSTSASEEAIFTWSNMSSEENDDGNNPGNVLKTIEDLSAGDEVIYTDGSGKKIPCIVIETENSIKLISKSVVGEKITLAGGNYGTNNTNNTYAKAIDNLNAATSLYLNTDIATSAYYSVGNGISYANISNLKSSLQSINAWNIESDYWIAVKSQNTAELITSYYVSYCSSNI